MPAFILVRFRYAGHLLFWGLLLAVVVAFDTVQDGHGPYTLPQYLARFGQLAIWLCLGRVMATVYFSLWVFTRYAFPRHLPLVLGQILLLGLFDNGFRYLLDRYVLPALTTEAPPAAEALAAGDHLLGSWLIVILAFVFKQLHDHRKSEALLHEKNAMELAYLKAQLNPHFLFNSMNNLYGLALTEPEKTPDAILMLADLMRYMLYESSANHVSLRQEVNYLNSYIALEKLRYEGDVHVDFAIEGNLEGVHIAPLLLICFVENAFKHGTVSNPAHPVQLYLAVQGHHLAFWSRNQIVAKNKDLVGGVGLASVRRRLALLYPQRHQLTVTAEHGIFECALELEALTPVLHKPLVAA
ncbi:histidine kinase [Hymenobacter sp. UV11]|uniref:sensor histidine kinase n=1 Tax=Hymenobacter sp. UV11 TaxID=1849735 RepID=UPI001060443D|nr:sensor histidine kinase [Hymenobacter sp. UV11]TDN37822.1 hypothetical protein A8B98_01815 [Hymenobacter sp. UV11]TFZ62294.1 histidine kinase [Hymenobacter sp. UV11]